MPSFSYRLGGVKKEPGIWEFSFELFFGMLGFGIRNTSQGIQNPRRGIQNPKLPLTSGLYLNTKF